MAAHIQLNNFRFSIYIDADGTVTLTDLPPELREVAMALNPAHQYESSRPVAPPAETPPAYQECDGSGQPPADVVGRGGGT